MSSSKLIPILKHFLNITILKIDGDGDIVSVVFNSKEGFDPTSVTNVLQLFSLNDRIRVERLIKVGTDDTKKFMEMASKFRIKEYADVEIYVEEGEIYVALKFFDSNRDKVLEYDRRLEELAEMAELDPLTGLLNRYGYWERIKGMLHCEDSDRKLGVVLVDVDNLKVVNDTLGHKAGDKAINQISNLISSSIRRRDVAVRYGGDEFVIVVEELSGSQSTAVGLAKRLLKKIRENRNKYLTTVSIGVHIVKVGDFTCCLKEEKKLRKCWDKAVAVSDSMAYKAKQDGRNRLVFSGDIKEPELGIPLDSCKE